MSDGRDTAANTACLTRNIQASDRGSDTKQNVSIFRQPRWARAKYPFLGKSESKIPDALVEGHSVSDFIICVPWRRLAHGDLAHFAERSRLPAFGNLPA